VDHVTLYAEAGIAGKRRKRKRRRTAWQASKRDQVWVDGLKAKDL